MLQDSASRRVDAMPGRVHAEFARHLLETGKLTAPALERAQNLAAQGTEPVEFILARLGLISDSDLAAGFSSFLNQPVLAAADFPDAPLFEDRLGRKFLKERHVIPIAERDGVIEMAMVNPLDQYTIDAVRFSVGLAVSPRIALPADIDAAYERLYGDGKSAFRQIVDSAEGGFATGTEEDADRLKDIASDAPVIRLVNLIITRAVETGASDIHIEPSENELRVRYRIDGVLQQMESPPANLSAALLSRIKLMAKLNIAERRLPQDGRIGIAVRGRDIDLRVATAPTIHGERVTMRILDRGTLKLDFDALGYEAQVRDRLRDVLAKPYGIFLVTGPTGSGKTTTLYAALLELNRIETNILTIEDPIEYQLPGINQVQVKPQIGLTFSSALRSFLRQDPDIMMIGEIRDLETAQIAVQAALTGHLILSTIHTNNAASTVTRLLDMGVEDYLLTSTMNGVAAQRLVRTLCKACKEPYTPLPEIIERLGLDRLAGAAPITLHRAVGCAACGHSGYKGRTAILEVLIMTDALRQAVLKNEEAGIVQQLAIEGGMQTMRVHGLRKALAGSTTIEEVLRATRVV